MHLRGYSRARALWYGLRYRKVATFGPRVRFHGPFRISGTDGKLTVGADVTFDRHGGRNHVQLHGGSVIIGARSYVNGLDVYATDSVRIGADATIGDVWIATTDFHGVGPEERWQPESVRTGPVAIGENVWLANRVAVLRSVAIGRDSVVGFGSVIVNDIPPRSVVAPPRSVVVRAL